MENNKYQNYITQFAIAFNDVANRAIANLENIGITKTKEELLADLFSEMKRQEEKKEVIEEPKNLIKPTINLDELPEQSKRNLMNHISTNNRWTPLLIAEIVRIFMDENYYAVEVRTISSNFITCRFKEEEFIELINREPKKEDNVFDRPKTYSITIK